MPQRFEWVHGHSHENWRSPRFQAQVAVAMPLRTWDRFGGRDRARTGDPLLAKQVLSQLSYSPPILVGLGRIELPTSPLSGVRSSQLSYRPGKPAISPWPLAFSLTTFSFIENLV